MKFWHVYRDGGLYLSHAPDPIDAADLAWVHKTDTDRVRLLGHWTGALRVGPHFVAYAYQTDRLRGTVVLLVDLRAGTVIVDKRDRLHEVDVLDAALSATAEVARLQAVEPTRVAVRRYRSGPRAGLPKFSRSDDAAKRAAVLAALAANERLETARASAAVRLAHCVDTLANGPVDLGTPATLAEAQTMRSHMERLRGALPWVEAVGDAFAEGRAWCSARLDELHRHAGRLASIEAHGFGVGARVVLQRSPYAAADNDEPEGPGAVLAAAVEGGEHTRLVRLDAGGREWWVSVRLLKGA